MMNYKSNVELYMELMAGADQSYMMGNTALALELITESEELWDEMTKEEQQEVDDKLVHGTR